MYMYKKTIKSDEGLPRYGQYKPMNVEVHNQGSYAKSMYKN
jgi:hypothetical protein